MLFPRPERESERAKLPFVPIFHSIFPLARRTADGKQDAAARARWEPEPPNPNPVHLTNYRLIPISVHAFVVPGTPRSLTRVLQFAERRFIGFARLIQFVSRTVPRQSPPYHLFTPVSG